MDILRKTNLYLLMLSTITASVHGMKNQSEQPYINSALIVSAAIPSDLDHDLLPPNIDGKICSPNKGFVLNLSDISFNDSYILEEDAIPNNPLTNFISHKYIRPDEGKIIAINNSGNCIVWSDTGLTTHDIVLESWFEPMSWSDKACYKLEKKGAQKNQPTPFSSLLYFFSSSKPKINTNSTVPAPAIAFDKDLTFQKHFALVGSRDAVYLYNINNQEEGKEVYMDLSENNEPKDDSNKLRSLICLRPSLFLALQINSKNKASIKQLNTTTNQCTTIATNIPVDGNSKLYIRKPKQDSN